MDLLYFNFILKTMLLLQFQQLFLIFSFFFAYTSSGARIFGLTAEQLANGEPLDLGPNVHIKMENVMLNRDTYIPYFEYDGNKSSTSKRQETEEEKDDLDFLSIFDDNGFEIGTETYEQAYRETRSHQKGVFAKLKELMRSMLRDKENGNER